MDAIDLAKVFNVPPQDQPSQAKPGQLSPDQLNHFFDEGYLILEDFIDKTLLEGVKKEWEQETGEIIEELFQSGKIKNKYPDKDLFHRMSKVNQEFPGASIIFHKSDKIGPNFKKVWSQSELLNVLEQILGTEVVGHPIYNKRIKPPHFEEAEVPWHQDNGYFDDTAAGTMIATAWIPLLDTNMDNGGMQVLRKTHKKGKLVEHICCAGNTWYIEIENQVLEEDLGCDLGNDIINCPVPYGGVLLFNNLLVHRSVPNISDKIRFSMDIRWQDPRKPNGRQGLETVAQMPLMRSKDKVITEVDFSVMSSRQKNDMVMAVKNANVERFETRIAGPWMNRWPIKHHNQHTKFLS